jgi:GntR family transcriptional repressor for pyruvate dehydrogenase complex
VAAFLEDLIVQDLEPGDSLPSEAEVADKCQVSRLTVREALRALAARGLVEISQGRRPRVADPNGEPLGYFFRMAVRRDPTAEFDLLEVRRAVETHIARVAATRMGLDEIEALGRAVAGMRESEEDANSYATADIAFHELLASATGNRMMAFLSSSLIRPLRLGQVRVYSGGLIRHGSRSSGTDLHAAVFDCIRARDPDAAGAAMTMLLREAELDLQAWLDSNAVPSERLESVPPFRQPAI